MNQFFEAEQMVIINSLEEIDCLQWGEYFLENWKILMKDQSKFLVLAGVHGESDGKVLMKDHDLLNDIKLQVQRLKTEKATDIKQKNIEISLIDIGEFLDESTEILAESQLVEEVKKHDPTIISLAFCRTNISILNDILRSIGIYSKLLISQDRFNITNGRVLSLDKEQTQIIEEISQQQFANIILWGSYGTGKTLLLVEALKIKISHYKKQNIGMKVFISSYNNDSYDSPLMEDFRERYLKHLLHEEFAEFIDFKHLCKGI